LKSRGSTAGETPGERAIVEQIRRRLPSPAPSLVVPIGDDAAVVTPERGALQVLTTDALVEGIHFERRFSSLSDIGYKAMAVNASDIAAMGGTSSVALLSLMLPEGIGTAQIDELLDGVVEFATASRISVAGGNVTRSPGPLVVDVMMTGHVRPRKVLTRGGGRPGDTLYVTGTIGGAAAGLEWLKDNFQPAEDFRPTGPLYECVARHRRPEPRLRIGALLGRNRAASACIDLSDGLADAVAQLATASGSGAAIDAEALPIHAGASMWFGDRGADPVLKALSGGDDYELLFSSKPKVASRLRTVFQQARGVLVTQIGSLTKDPAIVLLRKGIPEPWPAGFVHF
jgi:thiamine-monophosphate kinase